MDRTGARPAGPLQRARKSMVSTGRKTASGIRLCNKQDVAAMLSVSMFQYRKRYSPVQRRTRRRTGRGYHVSIPQAVFACATLTRLASTSAFSSFNTASGIRLCNPIEARCTHRNRSFNTASGIRLCNKHAQRELNSLSQFQYRKRYSPVQLNRGRGPIFRW